MSIELPKHYKETQISKPEAIGTGIANSAKTATNYIQADSTGIRIANANPATATTYQHQTATNTEFVVDGVSRAEISGDGARFGKEYVEGATDNESHLELDYHSMRIVDKDGIEFFEVEDLRERNGVYSITETIDYGEPPEEGELTPAVIQQYDFPMLVTAFSVTLSDGTDDTSNWVLHSAGDSHSYITRDLTIYGDVTFYGENNSSLSKSLTFGNRVDGSITGLSSVAIGRNIESSGVLSYAEGEYTIASGFSSHAEGHYSYAYGDYSHAEGDHTKAGGVASHAEGREAWATGLRAHAEGYKTTASGENSHAEGSSTRASAQSAHAEGRSSKATYDEAHAQNLGTIAAKKAQTAIGTFNVEDTSSTTTHPMNDPIAGQYALIIGNGTDSAEAYRSNAATIDWMGNYIGQAMAGIIQMFAGATPPTGWLVCDGSAISRTTYATLFAAIGTTWGSGDGSTTFNIPDLRGRAPIGAGTGSGLTARTLGGKLGEETHSLTANESGLRAHTHSFTQPTVKVKYSKSVASGTAANHIDGSSSSEATAPIVVSGGAVGAVTGGELNGSAHNNMQPSAVVNFIICTGKTS